ncbi:hypothetical protein C5167_039958 [Papaver somniferum]|uniref:Uncharacterized protein n=1 Tax=Papaver somniferum TaxID=3469 RepID=A0A4Y7IDL6_PAPSO|nr:hypothetical protein C5167_039958 [Papaver somniferum]
MDVMAFFISLILYAFAGCLTGFLCGMFIDCMRCKCRRIMKIFKKKPEESSGVSDNGGHTVVQVDVEMVARRSEASCFS